MLYAESLEPPIRSREILNLTHHLLRERSLAGVGSKEREKEGIKQEIKYVYIDQEGIFNLKFPALILPFLHDIFNISLYFYSLHFLPFKFVVL